MSESLFRAVVGNVVPLRVVDEVPRPYRQTLLPIAPLAPVSEAELPPITQDDVQLTPSFIGAENGLPE